MASLFYFSLSILHFSTTIVPIFMTFLSIVHFYDHIQIDNALSLHNISQKRPKSPLLSASTPQQSGADPTSTDRDTDADFYTTLSYTSPQLWMMYWILMAPFLVADFSFLSNIRGYRELKLIFHLYLCVIGGPYPIYKRLYLPLLDSNRTTIDGLITTVKTSSTSWLTNMLSSFVYSIKDHVIDFVLKGPDAFRSFLGSVSSSQDPQVSVVKQKTHPIQPDTHPSLSALD